jgi:glucan-binding YG repeat protein
MVVTKSWTLKLLTIVFLSLGFKSDKSQTFSKGDETNRSVDKAKVFKYKKFKQLKRGYRPAEKLRNISKNKFNPDSAFQILSSYRSITTQSSAPDTDMCGGWTISKYHLYSIIKHSRQIDGTEWDLIFDMLPCIIKGQLKQKGALYNFEVNGGSWLYLKSKDTTMILGDYNKNDEKYFIQSPMRIKD